MQIRSAAIAAAAALMLAATGARATTIYSNDFEGASTAGFTGGSITTAPNGQNFLGPLTQGATASLSLNTAGYSSLTVSFDLYGVLSLDGDGPSGGNTLANPDAFAVTSNSGAVIFDNSFANFPGSTQSFGGVGSAPQTGATSTNTLGYNGPGGTDDAMYSLTFTFAPTAGGTTQINFIGNSNQDPGDEFFGIDNVTVTGVPLAGGGVPEPASWALMLIGFGGLGAILRRHRKAVVAMA